MGAKVSLPHDLGQVEGALVGEVDWEDLDDIVDVRRRDDAVRFYDARVKRLKKRQALAGSLVPVAQPYGFAPSG